MGNGKNYAPYFMEKNRYCNPHIDDMKRTLFDVLLWKTGYYDDPKEAGVVPDTFIYPLPQEKTNPCLPSATWINHSTFFIKIAGLHILTDPIWSRRCSPFHFFGPIRHHEPALLLEDLGHLDFVLISHNHYDHLDARTVKRLHELYPNTIWCVPKGVKRWFVKRGITQVEEMSWWESHTFPKKGAFPQLKVTAVPAQHFSGRSLTDTNQTLWAGWVAEFLDEDFHKKLYFVGDTGYNAVDFKAIGAAWKNMDLSLIPIGTYVPRKFMSPVHIEPKDAVEIHKEVGSILSLAMHWKTFHLSDERMNQPPYDLYHILLEQKIDPLHFLAPPPGYAINW